MNISYHLPTHQRRLALQAAQEDRTPILILGAKGTEKTAVASWIHQQGPRTMQPFIRAESLQPIDFQLLQAQGGTLCIPEITQWSQDDQKQWLLFLQKRSIFNAHEGKSVVLIANVRVILTTSQDLDHMSALHLLKSPGFYQLNPWRIEIPKLYKRFDEFEDIVMTIVGEITRQLHKEHIKTLSADSWRRLKLYDWPGHFKELKKVLRVAVMSAQSSCIEEVDLPHFEMK